MCFLLEPGCDEEEREFCRFKPEFDAGDFDELIDKHEEEMTIEEIQLLQQNQNMEEVTELANEESVSDVVPTRESKDVQAMWRKIPHFVEKYNPQK